MPFVPNPLPSLLSTLHGANPPERPVLIFYSSPDESGQLWCPDCRRIESLVKEKFTPEEAPTGMLIYVGDKPTWKDPKNSYRKKYGISSVPTIIKLDANGKEAGRLVDDAITERSLTKFIDEY